MSQKLYEKLKEYGESDAYPFHMPGHKRRLGVPGECLDIDITEIDGFDNLHHAEGILKDAQERAAKLYGSEETFYLVNGSTAGILAAISACTSYGGRLLMARNCHKAAYHAAELRGLHTVYVYPQCASVTKNPSAEDADDADRSDNVYETLQRQPMIGGSIRPEDIQAALREDRGIQAVFITSPTYEGIVSDVGRIAEITHSFGIPLIVDEAHGAHFGFHPYFPESSVKKGADIVIHSLHKTLPSMTQTALLHRNGALVKSERIRKYLGMYQTSSPSYVFMASMDACVGLLETYSHTLFEDFAKRLEGFAQELCRLKHIHMYKTEGSGNFLTGHGISQAEGVFAMDPSKLVLWAEGKSGKWLSDRLRERFHLELEMEAGSYAIALTSIADTQEGFDRLAAALKELDEELEKKDIFPAPAGRYGNAFLQNEQILTIAETDERPQQRILLEDAAGRISAEYIYLYPPGIPLIVPGEEISRELIRYLSDCRDAGLSLQGLRDYSGKTISVIFGER